MAASAAIFILYFLMKFQLHLSRSSVQLFLAGVPIAVSAIPLFMLIFNNDLTLAEEETIATTVGILTPIVLFSVVFGYMKFANVPCQVILDESEMRVLPLKDTFFYRERIYLPYEKVKKIYIQTFRGEKVVIQSPDTGEFMIMKGKTIFTSKETDEIYKRFIVELSGKTGVPIPDIYMEKS